MVERKSYKILAINADDKEKVVWFLRKYFYKDEPVNSTLGITDCVDEETWFCGGLADGCSFKAINDMGEIIAVKLNAISLKNAPYELKTDHAQFNIALGLVKRILSEYNAFDEIPNVGDKILEGKVLTVCDDFRNQGIASALYQRTTDWMVENGIKHMLTMCSSHFTALACKKLGYEEVYSINYADYVEEGVCPILPKLPHVTLRVYLTTV